MQIVDCSCKGINPDCEKCFGRGYYDLDSLREIPIIHFLKKSEESKTNVELSFEEKISTLSVIEVRILILRFIKTIDSISNKQSQILLSIPFNSSRMSLINVRISELNKLETKKKELQGKLDLTCKCKQAELLNISAILKFKKLLSEIHIDSYSIEELILLKNKIIRESIKNSSNNIA